MFAMFHAYMLARPGTRQITRLASRAVTIAVTHKLSQTTRHWCSFTMSEETYSWSEASPLPLADFLTKVRVKVFFEMIPLIRR